MMQITFREQSVLIFCCFVLLFSIPKTRAQYSRAEIDRAVDYLTNRGLLNSLVAITSQDRTKLTSRPDVLMACYEIIRELDSVEEQLFERTDSINENLTEIRTMIANGGTVNAGNNALVERVLNEVEKSLPGSQESLQSKQSFESLQAQNVRIARELSELRNALKQAEPGLTQAAEIKKKTKQNRIIAITGVAVSAVIAILAAR